MPLGDTRARLVLGEAGGNGPRDLQKGASPSSIPSNSGLSRLVGKWTPPPGPWFSGLHNEELLWQQVRREGSLGFSPSTLSIPPPPQLPCLPAWSYKWRAGPGQECRPGGGPSALHPQGAAGPRAPGSLSLYIYSLWKPNPACTCPGLQAPCPCPGWTRGLSLSLA